MKTKTKIIAVMSPKGGIGKTITATSLAYILGQEQNKRVLIVDADAQGNASKIFDQYDPEGVGTPHLMENEHLYGDHKKTTAFIDATAYDHIDIITSNLYLMRANMTVTQQQDAGQVEILKRAFGEINGAYDYIIIDCGLFFDMTVINAIIAADMVVAPISAGGFELDAIEQLQEQARELRRLNPKLKIKGLMTMRQKNKFSLEMEEWLKQESGHNMFVTSIRRSIIVARATTNRRPVPAESKCCVVALDYRNVAYELRREMEG